MANWIRDYAVLHKGDEKYKCTLGRIKVLVVARDYSNRDVWVARTSDARNCLIQLTRRFDTKEEAMRAIEAKAKQLLTDALKALEESEAPNGA
jgi:hypothetical protein